MMENRGVMLDGLEVGSVACLCHFCGCARLGYGGSCHVRMEDRFAREDAYAELDCSVFATRQSAALPPATAARDRAW